MKEDQLAKIAEEVRSCKRCGLWRGRTNPVPGEGSANPLVMFVGEAPGRNEDLQGRPFVGAAGKLLDSLLAGIGLSRREVFIGNILKCRPPNNRDPLPSEIEACTPFLDRQIEVLKPKIIVALGRFSAGYLLSKAGLKPGSLPSIRGRIMKVNLLGLSLSFMATFHPAAALYNPKLKKALEEDFGVLGGWLKLSGSMA